ncbi:flavin-containing monooxygenase [Rhodococcus opacus]|uniref:flavin-containing monooxygenase n=1 Tax=Rhodococcus opacus TaxID=37919 RepID=UPI0024757D40|nr:NAD(P)/FAD-dependent oxidoreductase [Rhodococcus opacus]MDH6291980.1 cation diffusion facilitator CzcD-associated flavoprotein CzcO [Rhodococcus opacus]
MNESTNPDVVVVGAGLGGLYQLYALRQAGLTARVIEAGDGVGGTWYWNKYPGARCDVESMFYSYSFSPELEQEWEWSEKFPTQPELLKYINHVADRFDLRRDITLNTRVTSAHWDVPSGKWRVTTDTGEVIEAGFVVMATGCLSMPKEFELPGQNGFKGQIYHTGRWPEEGVDFTGQRVGLIGTGSSGIQSIPVIADQALEMTVFQRTPSFTMPAGNRPLDDAQVKELKGRYRELREAQRNSSFGNPFVSDPTKSAFDVSDDERLATYRDGWNSGSLVAILSSYTDVLTDKKANETAAGFIRSKIAEMVRDPEIAETLTPRSYPYGSKRPCLDTGYYDTFNKDHVRLVDLRKTPLVEITESGIRTSEDEYEVDAIVLATGYDAMTGALNAIDIRGRSGVALREKWSNGPVSYLGLAVSEFPNLFTLTGPSSPSVLTNMILAIEQHVDWIVDCLQYMRSNGYREIESTEDAETKWAMHVAEVGNATLFPDADSWYMGANVPGKPRVFMAYVGGANVYRQKCDEVVANDYEGFSFRR